MAKSDYDIAPDATYYDAAHAALRRQFQELMDNVEGTRLGEDPEFLHDMRVASRRLRAAMSVFEAAFPAKRFRRVEKQVAQITDALGAVRDADVLVEFLQKECDVASPAEQVGIDAFIADVQAQRAKDRVGLVKALDKLQRGGFSQEFEALLAREEEDVYG